MTVDIEGITVHLAHPDELPEGLGQAISMAGSDGGVDRDT